MDAAMEQLVACQRLALLGRLSIYTTHEVNNQLAGISGYAQLLLGQERAKAVERELDKIFTSANRCQKLIADMRRIGRFNSLERDYNNVNLIVKSALDLIRRQFEKKSLQVAERYASSAPPIEVDTTALEQVFLNILQNSLEALSEKGGSLTVTTSVEDTRIVATFEDDGPGLTDEARANLFTPFFTTKKHMNCSGLGLAVAKTIVEEHGGTLTVENSLSGGARVSVGLPCVSDPD
jgi:C4-dicarboxylate-specific signal transduction histidine kinase